MRRSPKTLLRTLSVLAAAALTSCSQHGRRLTLVDHETRKPVPYAGRFSDRRIRIPVDYRERPREMRGIWVATIANLDFPPHRDAASFRRKFRAVLGNLRRCGFNAVVFQVRPLCDAFYPSAFNPWSRHLAGREGRGIPGFDPLRFMVEEAHRHGIQFHAWLNPYRVVSSQRRRKDEYLATLSERSFARRNPQLVLERDHRDGRFSLILDPGRPEVRAHLRDTVREIAANYRVDAIHFDDYFYPYDDDRNDRDGPRFDEESFRLHNPRRLGRDDWRRDNVNAMVRDVRLTLDSINRRRPDHPVAFGISPFGIWANRRSHAEGSLTGGCQSYFTLYADSKHWIENGLVDYIVPQLYWEFAHPVAAYACLADWWAEAVRGSRVKLYIGQAAYRTWNDAELPNQLRYNSANPRIAGSVFFSYRSFFGKRPTVPPQVQKTIFRRYWRHPATPPR